MYFRCSFAEVRRLIVIKVTPLKVWERSVFMIFNWRFRDKRDSRLRVRGDNIDLDWDDDWLFRDFLGQMDLFYENLKFYVGVLNVF